MKFLFILEQIQIQMAKYSKFWSLYVNRVFPHVPPLMTLPPPYNRIQNKHVKILHCSRVPYCALFKEYQKPAETLADLIGLDSVSVKSS